MTKDKCMFAYENKIKEFANRVKNKKILDLGCGNGDYTSLFTGNNNRVFGVDINDFRQKRYINKFEFVKYNGKRLPFINQEFDIVVSFDVIEHVENDNLFMEEIYRVLKKHGQVYLATPNRNRLSNVLMKILGRPVRYPYKLSDTGRLGEVIHLREYIGKELVNLLGSNNFLNIDLEPFWFGLRGGVNRGINKPIIKSLAQYIFVKAQK